MIATTLAHVTAWRQRGLMSTYEAGGDFPAMGALPGTGFVMGTVVAAASHFPIRGQTERFRPRNYCGDTLVSQTEPSRRGIQT